MIFPIFNTVHEFMILVNKQASSFFIKEPTNAEHTLEEARQDYTRLHYNYTKSCTINKRTMHRHSV